MTNKNVIEIIDRLMNPNAYKVAYNIHEVFTAIAHGYYYIRPGRDTTKFMKRINKVLNRARKLPDEKLSKSKDGIPYIEIGRAHV